MLPPNNGQNQDALSNISIYNDLELLLNLFDELYHFNHFNVNYPNVKPIFQFYCKNCQ